MFLFARANFFLFLCTDRKGDIFRQKTNYKTKQQRVKQKHGDSRNSKKIPWRKKINP